MTAAKNSAPAGDLSRLARAADTHSWSLAVIPSPAAVMATKESGRVGEPWVVMAARGGRGMRVSLYRPGDALDVEGEEVGELSGNPREMGRQLRSILEDLAEGAAA
jgi:hypothetical protein